MKMPFSKTIKQNLDLLKLRRGLRKEHWLFSEGRLKLILSEWKEWEKYYLPVDVKGKVVLDVGAGEGETAYFFLRHGAERVVCVEPDKVAYDYLLVNARVHPEMTVLTHPFENRQLEVFTHALLKMDIEGYEESLLEVTPPSPAVIEVHGLQLRDKFKRKGYIIKYNTYRNNKEICYAYWRCG